WLCPDSLRVSVSERGTGPPTANVAVLQERAGVASSSSDLLDSSTDVYVSDIRGSVRRSDTKLGSITEPRVVSPTAHVAIFQQCTGMLVASADLLNRPADVYVPGVRRGVRRSNIVSGSIAEPPPLARPPATDVAVLQHCAGVRASGSDLPDLPADVHVSSIRGSVRRTNGVRVSVPEHAGTSHTPATHIPALQ